MACRGKGYLYCSACKGTGYCNYCEYGITDCTYCLGDGWLWSYLDEDYVECSYCNGTAKQRCLHCLGDYHNKCYICHGIELRTKCPHCNGTGRDPNYVEEDDI